MRGISVISFGVLLCLLAGCAADVDRNRLAARTPNDGISITTAGAEAESEGLAAMVKAAANMSAGLDMMTKCIGPTEKNELTSGLANAKTAYADLDKELKGETPSLEVIQAKILLIKDGMKDMKIGTRADNADMKAANKKMAEAAEEMDKAVLLLLAEAK